MLKGKSSKSWREKLEKDIHPKLVKIPARWAQRIGEGTMLIPSPLLIGETIKKIPKSKLATVNIIRDYLADKYEADITCPLTTGIFLNIAANTAEEDSQKGKIKITPYWRVLKEGGYLNSKFPGGVQQQAKHLEQEGFVIEKVKGKDQFFVKAYNKKLVLLS